MAQATPNLQEVTDEGNTTDNDIIVEDTVNNKNTTISPDEIVVSQALNSASTTVKVGMVEFDSVDGTESIEAGVGN